MATEEHKYLSNFLKDVHLALRESSADIGVDKAWHYHCRNKDVLKTYAQYMQKLATTHWEKNASDELSSASSRITWSADFAYKYFINKSYLKQREKEIDIGNKINIKINNADELFTKPFKLLDVPIQSDTVIIDNKVIQLKENSFDIVTFCFLLEYIPSSELRIKACEQAYKLLRIGGLLLISTPDSKHVGANSKQMKCWRYTLAIMGFSRIKYEKFKHMHCLAFRKCSNKEVAERWATLHKESYMNYSIHIPQDFKNKNECKVTSSSITVEVEDFRELPFNIIS
ncbi:jg27779 [Pararge aegeria aegeria]|uniref:Jg27779 protein n=1 Tax=Pararge aegeria aegeria TaxID=348720 RepID=A0A8S4S714_9NEOP|nr:jg27779 [Pararge aegeria aegeria]